MMAGFKDFRRMALGLKGAVEGAHMGHPDFRLENRIFATLHPDLKFGMVKLEPSEQHRLVNEHPAVFAPESGAWGRQGCTSVRLQTVDEGLLGEALTLAWQDSSRGRPVKRSRSSKAVSRPRRSRKP